MNVVRRLAVFTALAIACVGLASKTARADLPPEGDVRFKVTCDYTHSLPDDPIVYPNQPGQSHLHSFFGNFATDAFTTTYDDLQGALTSCNDDADKAAYWVPAVYNAEGEIDPIRVGVYYRRGSKAGTIEPYPDGLKIVAGYGEGLPQPPADIAGWQCNGKGPRRSSPTGCRRELTMVIVFPDCWDGVHLDSVDHRSHMSYSVFSDRVGANVCDHTHPVQMPALTMYVNYPEGVTPVTSLSSGAGTTVHGDFFNGWDADRLAYLVDYCLNGLRFCTSGD